MGFKITAENFEREAPLSFGSGRCREGNAGDEGVDAERERERIVPCAGEVRWTETGALRSRQDLEGKAGLPTL